jgi:hypothetical protein
MHGLRMLEQKQVGLGGTKELTKCTYGVLHFLTWHAKKHEISLYLTVI